MASTGDKRQKWIDSIKKELDSVKNNHATEVIGHDLKEKCRQVGNFLSISRGILILKVHTSSKLL
eukprot:4311693-Amphidinium_carterae.1